MSFRDFFGPSKKEIWQKLCPEIDGTFVDGGFWKSDQVIAKVDEWVITLDTYTISTGRTASVYTRMRAPYINKDGFRFKLYRKSMFSGLEKLFGMQDLKVRTSFLDDKYIIQGNNRQKVQELFSNPRVCALIKVQPDNYLEIEIKNGPGLFGRRFPKEGISELHLLVGGVIKDMERLKSLFELFSEIMRQLSLMDSASPVS
jgi:hypothetical protein